jgi:hypothetical protein
VNDLQILSCLWIVTFVDRASGSVIESATDAAGGGLETATSCDAATANGTAMTFGGGAP